MGGNEKNGNKSYWIGVDIGGTKIQATLFGDSFKPLLSERKKTKGQEGKEEGMKRLSEVISIVMKNISQDKVKGIGVGCAGPLNLEDGSIIEAPNLGWKNVPVKKFLEKEFKVQVEISNDVDAGTYGEYKCGSAKKARSVLGIFPGTGIGGGFVYEGKLIRGKNSSCMEIGHLCVMPSGPICGCGQKGCLEAVASRLAIASNIAAAAYRGEAPSILEEAGTDLKKIRSKVIARSIERGEKTVEEIVRRAASFIGKAAGMAVNLLAPEIILLGGGMISAMPGIFLEEVKSSAEKTVMRSFRDTFKVVTAKLGDDATALGAAAWAKEVIEGKEG